MINLSMDPVACKLLVQFAYRPELVDKIKTITGRKWKKPYWTLPLTAETIQNVEIVFGPTEKVYKDEKLLEFLKRKNEKQTEVLEWKSDPGKLDLIPGTRFHTTPYEHQKRMLAFCQRRGEFALFAEMGTGKTKVIIDLLGNYYLEGYVKVPSLIVSPIAVINNWRREAELHQPGLKVVVAQGTEKQKLQALDQVHAGEAHVIVINYESLWRMAERFDREWFAMVLDESTKIKHRATKQAKAILKLGKRAARKYIMTGTPAPNNPLELFNQIKFLDETIFGSHWYAFRDRYAVMGGFGGHQILGWRNLPELTKKVATISYRVLKKDCLDLPEKVYKEYRIPMDKDQAKVYKEMADTLVTSVKDSDIVATVVLTKLTKLRQLASGFVYDATGASKNLDKNPKLDQLEEILVDICKSHKVVVWTSFKEESTLISALCIKLGLEWVKFDGSVEAQKRDDIIQRFQKDPSCKVFIGQQHAGGLGITLTAADYCVFFSNDYSSEIRLQAEDRLHRIGQKNNVVYIDLIMKGTVDSTMKRMLTHKATLAESLVPSKIEDVVYGDNL